MNCSRFAETRYRPLTSFFARFEALSDAEAGRAAPERVRQVVVEFAGRARRPRDRLEALVPREAVLGLRWREVDGIVGDEQALVLGVG